MNNTDCMTIDGETYTKKQLADRIGESEDWVERKMIYPTDVKTKKPLATCMACGAEFGAQKPCPACESPRVRLVLGVRHVKRGNEEIFVAEDVKQWLRSRARAGRRPTWENYYKEFEEG